jgi:hypothetical protein
MGVPPGRLFALCGQAGIAAKSARCRGESESTVISIARLWKSRSTPRRSIDRMMVCGSRSIRPR